jgi:hypothetical protein
MRNDTDVAPQQHMFKRVSSSGVLVLMDEGGGGMQSMVCVLKMESDGTSRGCGTKDIRGKQHVTRHTSHVTRHVRYHSPGMQIPPHHWPLFEPSPHTCDVNIHVASAAPRQQREQRLLMASAALALHIYM